MRINTNAELLCSKVIDMIEKRIAREKGHVMTVRVGYLIERVLGPSYLGKWAYYVVRECVLNKFGDCVFYSDARLIFNLDCVRRRVAEGHGGISASVHV